MADYREPETNEEFEIIKDNLALATSSERDMFKRYLNKSLPAEEFIENGGFELFVRLGYFIPNVSSVNALIGSYEDFDIKAEPLKVLAGIRLQWLRLIMMACNMDLMIVENTFLTMINTLLKKRSINFNSLALTIING